MYLHDCETTSRINWVIRGIHCVIDICANVENGDDGLSGGGAKLHTAGLAERSCESGGCWVQMKRRYERSTSKKLVW